MGYSKTSGQWADTQDVTLQASTTKTASFTSPGVEVGDRGNVRLKLNVSAASGTTPTLDVVVETSFDNGSTDAYRTVASFAQKTGVTAERKSFPGLDRWVRVRATIGGTTPSFTYDVSGEFGR